MKRVEIRWYRFQKPDKRRPVVIIMCSSSLDFLNEVTVAPITTTIRNIPSEVLLKSAEGMPRRCAVNTEEEYLIIIWYLVFLSRIAQFDCGAVGILLSACHPDGVPN